MTTFTYTKSLTSDFSGNLHTTQLMTEINADPNIAPQCICVTNLSDTVNIIFDSSLTAPQQTTLDTLISSHTPDTSPKRTNNVFRIYPNITRTKSPNYFNVATFDWSSNLGKITYIDLMSKGHPSTTSYSARIMDTSTGSILAESTSLTNTTFSPQNLGPLSNLPTTPTVLELQVKTATPSHYIHIQELLIYYDD